MLFSNDKLIDAGLIFVSILAAFYFDQYQENSALKKELSFNLSEIMRDLPSEPPETVFPHFKIEQKEKEDGTCFINSTTLVFDTNSLGSKYLDLIKERGLVRFINSESIIRKLTFYYEEAAPTAAQAHEEFVNNVDNVIDSYDKYKDPKTNCFKPEKITQMSEEAGAFYQKHIVADGFSKMLGHQILQDLIKMGYEKRSGIRENISYKFEFKDPEESKPK